METKAIANAAVGVACKMLLDGAQGRAKRFDDIKKNEDSYFGVISPALKGRSNISFDSVVMGGFIDTLLANIKQDVRIVYGHTREQDKISADKVSAVWAREAAPDRGDWNQVFNDTKMMAALSGVGINKLFFESIPRFRNDLSVVDHYDFVAEPVGGADLDKHLYKFQMNIFRTRQDLMDGVGAGYYDKVQVANMIREYQNITDDARKNINSLYQTKSLRYATFGIDIATMGYVGQPIYRLTEGVMNYQGKWYYIVFSFETKEWVRFEPLEDVFEHARFYTGRGPWTAWQTHRHPMLFWSKAPADDVRPIGYTMKKMVNYTIDNLEKINWNMSAYDPKIFTDPAALLWKQDGLVRATLKQGQRIDQGIFRFQTPDTTSITINMVTWLDQFLGKKTGITGDSQGVASTDNASVLVQNLQQVSKRMTLENDRFKKSVVDLGVMFDYGVYEYLREPYAVKIIGIKGAQWEEEVTRKDSELEFSCDVRAGDEEEKKNLLAAQRRELAFQRLDKHPELMQKLNQSEYLRTIFEDAGISEEKMAALLDANNDGDALSSAHAAQAIQDCLENKPLYKMYRDATPAFIEKIIDFCAQNFELIPDTELSKLPPSEQKRYAKEIAQFDKLMAYAEAHAPIAEMNMTRKAVSVIAQMGAAQATPVAPTARPVNPTMAGGLPGGGAGVPTATPVA